MDIIKVLNNNIELIKKEYSVERIGVFGSYAKGIQTESSDIDIIVEFKNPTYDNFINLAFYLEKMFGKKIDLVTVKGMSPYIYPYVKKEVIWC